MIATGSVISQRYEILDLISGGGMAEVFRARRIEEQIRASQYVREAQAQMRAERRIDDGALRAGNASR